MIISNNHNSRVRGGPGFKAFLLIGQTNTPVQNLSIQYSEVEVGKEQPLHQHAPEQCYYIIEGQGLMTIDDEACEVFQGDAIYIPANAVHGIKNRGAGLLKYLTANAPAFDMEYENGLWPA